MYRRLAMTQRPSHVSLPLVLLAVVSVLSLAARTAWLGQPCRAPCRSASDHLLIFDEAYYVNAARVIAGLTPAANQKYSRAPLGDDPNSEHPQLAKLVIAGSIELFGDGPFAWRLGSIVLGSLAILGLFVLVRSAGGGQWLALGAAALMASDALLLIHGRIGTLDIYVLPAMIWGAVLYLRGRPIAAGAVIGIGSCVKLVAPYVLLVLVLLEGLRLLHTRGRKLPIARIAIRLGACAASAAAVFVGLLAILDRVAPPYDATTGKLLAAGPFHHIAHMFSYAASQTSPHGPQGIASYPWQWMVDYKPITYLNINPSHPSPGLTSVHPAAHFLGMISPPVMLLALPALVFVAWEAGRGANRAGSPSGDADAGVERTAGEVPILGLAWFLGTFVPFELLSLFWSRTSYLYYMVVVMPGIYLVLAYLVFRARRHRRLVALWMFSVLAAAVVMYPFTPLP
jgi:4-amino-4-deoxy-L-arabinose transferase-like glycosyltransferase